MGPEIVNTIQELAIIQNQKFMYGAFKVISLTSGITKIPE